MRDYTQYMIWQDAIKISIEVYDHTSAFPSEERFGLVSQLRRSAVSVASNIAEGCSRDSEKEFKRFLEIALGSAFEMKTQLTISNKVGLLRDQEFHSILNQIDQNCRQINALRNKLLETK